MKKRARLKVEKLSNKISKSGPVDYWAAPDGVYYGFDTRKHDLITDFDKNFVEDLSNGVIRDFTKGFTKEVIAYFINYLLNLIFKTTLHLFSKLLSRVQLFKAS